MKYKSGLFFILFFLSSLAVTLYAQETAAEAAAGAETAAAAEEQAAAEAQSGSGETAADGEIQKEGETAKEEPPSPEKQRLELEIKTSTLPELAAWSRSLGLSEGGTRADLSRRIRERLELPEPGEQADDNRKVITIESAHTTEYFTIEVVDEDYARLKGEVRLSLKDKDSVHNIKAGEILFNRTRNILTARGGVEYRKEKEGTTEIFRGESITVNIDDWSSIFLGGNSERKLSNEDTTYRFAGSVISRNNDDDVMIINNAQISNANSEEALWYISASKVWLLPGSDFAIFNAWLKVGEIPVLYIPFFYFPADEVIFHPVVGYRSREGAFVQTTTYILGRPKINADEQNSLSRIMGNANDMEKERNGLFLRSTGKKAKDPSEISLKAMLDYYTNLGAYLGFDLSTPKKGILNELKFSLGLGFTRTVQETSLGYTPYAPNYDGAFDWNNSNLFSMNVPFRYRMETKSSISGKYGSVSWDLPFYSDPYVNMDFLDRSENMDWMNMIQQGAAIDENTVSKYDIGSNQQWQINGRLNPSLPILSPYVSSISFSSISTTLAFKKIPDNEKQSVNRFDPGRDFFAPDKYTIYSVSGSVLGTPLTIGGGNQASSSSSKADVTVTEIDDPLKDIGVPRPPWAEETDEAEKKSAEEKLIPPVLNQRFELPRTGNAKFSIDYEMKPTSSTELQFMSGYNRWKSYDKVDWSEVQSVLASAGGNGTLNFHMDHSAGLFSNTVTFSGNGTLRDYLNMNEGAEAYTHPSVTGTWKGVSTLEFVIRNSDWQYIAANGEGIKGTCVISTSDYINTATLTVSALTNDNGTTWTTDLSQLDGTTIIVTKRGKNLIITLGNKLIKTGDVFEPETDVPDLMKRAREEQYRQTNYSSSYTYNGTLRPLYNNSVFSQSNLQYTFRGTLVRSKRYTDGDGPELTPQWGAWVKEKTGEDILGLNSHRLSANLAANIMDKQQTISVNADLPPLDALISTNATFRVWISETTASIQFKKPEMINNEPNDEWKIDPFNFRETLRFGKVGSFSYFMVMDPEKDNEITTITSSLTLWNFGAGFSAVMAAKYKFKPDNQDNPSLGGRWVQEGEPSLNPKDLSFTYKHDFSNIEIIKNRMSFTTNLNTQLSFDLQQHTNSKFIFSMGFSMAITGFLELSLSARSENAVIWRYFKNVPGMEDLTAMYIEGDQNNLFIDFFDSFNFADENKRQRSGFKMKSFSLTAKHFLGDWEATLGIEMYPFPVDQKYEIRADVSFLLKWLAISEIKSDIKLDGRNDRWIVK